MVGEHVYIRIKSVERDLAVLLRGLPQFLISSKLHIGSILRKNLVSFGRDKVELADSTIQRQLSRPMVDILYFTMSRIPPSHPLFLFVRPSKQIDFHRYPVSCLGRMRVDAEHHVQSSSLVPNTDDITNIFRQKRTISDCTAKKLRPTTHNVNEEGLQTERGLELHLQLIRRLTLRPHHWNTRQTITAVFRPRIGRNRSQDWSLGNYASIGDGDRTDCPLRSVFESPRNLRKPCQSNSRLEFQKEQVSRYFDHAGDKRRREGGGRFSSLRLPRHIVYSPELLDLLILFSSVNRMKRVKQVCFPDVVNPARKREQDNPFVARSDP